MYYAQHIMLLLHMCNDHCPHKTRNKGQMPLGITWKTRGTTCDALGPCHQIARSMRRLSAALRNVCRRWHSCSKPGLYSARGLRHTNQQANPCVVLVMSPTTAFSQEVPLAPRQALDRLALLPSRPQMMPAIAQLAGPCISAAQVKLDGRTPEICTLGA
jgi:hypothetical protein